MSRISFEIRTPTDEQKEMKASILAKFSDKTGAQILDLMMRKILEEQQPSMRGSTHEKIHKVVTNQMNLNASTDKVITVGVGDNARQVRYQQRAITGKWIMENAGATFKACKEYLEQHAQEIADHHKTVLGLTDPKKIENFNRSTGKASSRV